MDVEGKPYDDHRNDYMKLTNDSYVILIGTKNFTEGQSRNEKAFQSRKAKVEIVSACHAVASA